MRSRSLILALAAAAALVLGTAAPALADHNAGAELYNPDIPDQCYAGAITEGTPPVDIYTSRYTLVEKAGRLHLVCTFTVPARVEAPDGGIGESKGTWIAPTRPTVSLSAGTCLPPGVDAASELWPDDETRSVPASQAKIVAYRTTIVMYCSWALDDLP
ncbi:hypothetical protein JOD63_000758 [Microbacterium terrae]|uniref:Uncharacterized protein n=1 Tax=Microbacterium terrae TaxID=69369 RepID=A0A0M2GYX1_9MICO|nr:hypothetical protein [Microbacterium terrae]KJL39277.1 hypothetical protein RS81_02120 [Microbacterium terrae]MBP1076790.1 hypothetical protein [Microbacterium terrae]GLJ99384.1 hypothetical protein GCM10017594_25820 [Microbacterium terrae]